MSKRARTIASRAVRALSWEPKGTFVSYDEFLDELEELGDLVEEPLRFFNRYKIAKRMLDNISPRRKRQAERQLEQLRVQAARNNSRG
jgi:hypothetical protein